MSQPQATGRRFGVIALAGPPNAGKSTLFNALVGERLAIISDKPQSTQRPVTGLWTRQDTQLLFLDPPGLFEPNSLLHHRMIAQARHCLRAAHGVIYLHPADQGPPPAAPLPPDWIRERQRLRVVVSKADGLPATGRRDLMAQGVLPVVATTGEGVETLLEWCREVAPPGPFRFGVDQASTLPLRFFAAESVRESAFELLSEELPYAIATEVEEFREGSTPTYVRIIIYVERESQRRIVVGQGGQTIRALGTRARGRIEGLIGAPVFLDLWVKTLPKWRSRAASLDRLGYTRETGGDDELAALVGGWS